MNPGQFEKWSMLLGEAVLLVQKDGKVLAANAAVGRLGVPPENCIGRPLAEIVATPNDDLLDFLRRCSRSSQPIFSALTMRAADGSEIKCRCDGLLAQHVPDGGLSTLILKLTRKEVAVEKYTLVNEKIRELNQEIQRRRSAEETLRQQKEFLRTTLTSIRDGVIVTDKSGKVILVNPVAAELTQWALEDAKGTHLNWVFRVISESSRDPLTDRVQSALEQGSFTELTHEALLIAKGGLEKSIDFNAGPICSDSGETIGIVLVFRDVSERKRLVRELQEAGRRKDEFLATLAHELRNPLAPIRTCLEVMKMVKDDPDVIEEMRQTMERQLKQLVALIDDLMDVSRITRGKINLKPSKVELSGIVRSAVEAIQPLMDQQGHEFSISVPDDPIFLNADSGRLAQVISNLLHNAAKYTPKNGRIWLAVRRESSREIVISVKDNGSGIPADKLDHIFDMFAQLDRILERTHSGLGIGLTVVKSLVAMHGGTIKVFSGGIDQGSEFIVTMPVLVEGEAQEDEQKDRPQRIQLGKKSRILVVDDNRAAAETLCSMLTILGHEVETAHDGIEGLEAAKRHRPDLVLLDLGMPRLNGFETATRLRAESWGRSLAIVALTGWGQPHDRERTKAAGFDEHLVKPVEPELVQQIIAKLVN